MTKGLQELNEVLFEQLDLLNKTDTKQEDFQRIREKADSIAKMGDLIIKNSELALKNEVWQYTRRTTPQGKLKQIGAK